MRSRNPMDARGPQYAAFNRYRAAYYKLGRDSTAGVHGDAGRFRLDDGLSRGVYCLQYIERSMRIIRASPSPGYMLCNRRLHPPIRAHSGRQDKRRVPVAHPRPRTGETGWTHHRTSRGLAPDREASDY